jgi:hypothetical protein
VATAGRTLGKEESVARKKAVGKEVIVVEAEPIKTEVTERTTDLMSLHVTNEETFQKAGVGLQWCKSAKKEIDRVFDPIVEAAHNTHKKALAQKNEVAGPVKLLDAHLRGEVSKYAERKENERRVAEQNALAAQQEQAAALEAGEEVEYAPMQSLQKAPEAPTAEGLGFRDQWKFRILNLDAIPREYLMADEAKIGKVVDALGRAAGIPGIEVYSVKVPIVR